MTTSRRSRKVSSLTPSQLQRKRELDRQSQAASRQRAKSWVRQLEHEVAVARAPQDYEHVKHPDGVVQENQELRRLLARIGKCAADAAQLTWRISGADHLEGLSLRRPLSPVPLTKSGSPFAVLPRHTEATCTLDHMILDFLRSRRDMIRDGAKLSDIMDPGTPQGLGMVCPNSLYPTDKLCGIIMDILNTFSLLALPERAAFFYVMYQGIRWQLSPTEELYVGLPYWLRPTAAQVIVPHPIWIDNVPWPHMRDILIQNTEKYSYEVFSGHYSHNVTINWPSGHHDIFDESTTEYKLSTIFERHVRNLDNWTLKPAFKDCFPALHLAACADK